MKTRKTSLNCLIALVFLLAPMIVTAQLSYPVTKQQSQTDNYFGTTIPDPYRWLENDTAADTKAWVNNQQQFTEAYLSKIPFRDKIKNRYKEILNYSKYYGALKVGDYVIYGESDGVKNQPIYYIQKGIKGEPKVFIDPNQMSKDGTVSVRINSISNDKKYITYGVNKGGSDWLTLYVMDVATQTKLTDEINWLKFGGVSWCGKGFYYSRYDKPAEGTELSAKNEFNKVYYHVLGEKQENDKLVYEDKKHPNLYISPQVTENERYLFIVLSPGTDGTEYWYKDLTSNETAFKLLYKGFQYNYYVLDAVSDGLLVYTNDGADNYKVIHVDPEHPQKENWKDIIPEKAEKLESANTGGGKLFCSYLKDASTKIYQYSFNGELDRLIELPGIGTASAIGGFKDDTCFFYDYDSFTYPPSIFSYTLGSGKSEVFKKSNAKISTDDYTTDQVFYQSKDGTRVPMFIVHKKNIPLDGTHPTLLYAYGGFAISETPSFSNSRFILLEQNGIAAITNIRGGGEYGEKWHKGGNLLNKQNGFDDFIAAAHYLIDKKYTSNNLLAINGGSNGGLLVGAVTTQEPNLFKVALPEVGVMDMLRFQKFTVGWGWAVEYGSSDSAKYFPYLLKYSPLHNIKKGTANPATLVLTADHDDRVVPAHSFKFAATLQANQVGTNPVLIRIDINQGHGASGSSLNNTINEETDKWSFMFYNMGIVPDFKK